MKTYEMVQEADLNGKTYITGDMRYNRNTGFVNDMGATWGTDAWKGCSYNGIKDGLNAFIHEDEWEEEIPRKMTHEEIAQALGYDFEII